MNRRESADPAARTQHLLVIAVAFLTLTAALVVSLERSLISHSISGQVRSVDWVGETGYALQTIELVDGDRFVVDRAVGERLSPGATVEKDAWSRRIRVDGRVVALSVSGEVVRFVVAGTIMLLSMRSLVLSRRTPDVGEDTESGNAQR